MTTKRSSDDSAEEGQRKQLNTTFNKLEILSFFNSEIFNDQYKDDLKHSIATSQPYHWGHFTNLIDDTLLRNVRKEVLSEIAFTKKETDIYKVYQSGDLANLSGLNWDDLSRLPSVYKLRAAIYSQQFRDLVSYVTGCGKLLGVKTDMSINTYTNGCHLLTHDDVIGSRRVSFILYMPDPNRHWKPSYGGGLRLYPSIVPNVPQTDHSAKFVPQFNEMAFFTVQPGHSFHDVEEVREDRQRLSIQGWFHIPQPGEDGFIEGEQEETEARSTLQLLQSKELQEYDFPKPERIDTKPEELELYRKYAESQSAFLSEEDQEYLKKYINPVYLVRSNVLALKKEFEEEQVVEIKNLLKPEYADLLQQALRRSELEEPTPANSTEIKSPWKCAIPPHKQRFMYIDGKAPFELTEDSIAFINHIGPQEYPNFDLTLQPTTTESMLCEVVKLIKSALFKKWLVSITSLIPTSEQALVRRFRPGHDFILATPTDKHLARSETEENVLLEATFNLTPTAINHKNWEHGEFGGYELCLALTGADGREFDEDDDPAIYRANDSNDDSVLYTSQCKWNSLTLMVRDPSVMKFIKYVSINAKGSRWDISCQWNVESVEDEENDDEDED